jgi:hypothetical protein
MIRFPLIYFTISFLLLASSIPGRAQDEAATAAAARKILDAWHADNPKPGKRTLHIICWRPMDRPFAPDHRQRLTRIMEHILKFYADEMERHGFGRCSIQLNYDDDKLLTIHHAVGSANFADYTKPEGERVRKDCWPVLKEAGIDPDRETVLIFTNLSDWDPVNNTFQHKSPYYARGNSRQGLAWQLDSPELDTQNLKLKEPIIQDGEYGKISLGKHNSIFIGGIAHELGHGLGLPHCRERRDEKNAHGTALMGSGNRTYFDQVRGEGKGTFLTLAHALRLASHPQFSGSVKGMNQPARADFSEIAVVETGDHFALSGHLDSVIPVYAVIAYLDPEGGGDYDARTVCTVPGSDGKFTLDCWPLQRGVAVSDIRVVALLANGATSTWRSSFRMNDTKLDISLMKTTTELGEFVAALNGDRLEEAKQLADALSKGSHSKIVAQNVLVGRDPKRSTTALADIPAETKAFPLSQITPAEAAVGWQKPAYDHLPREGSPLLVSGGELFPTGIYAHAEARHIYQFPEDSTWKTLTGKCGLPTQRGGSVVFVIKTDGKEVFRSPTTEPGPTHPYDIDLSGVKQLELLTEDGGDGKGVDWGLWLAPMIGR